MKYLYFETDGDGSDGVCIPASSVVGIDCAANTAIIVYFADLGGANSNDGKVTLTVTANKTKEAAEDIAKAIYQGAETFVTIADDQNSEYVSSHITACAAIVLAA
jgi:hypothetical protein